MTQMIDHITKAVDDYMLMEAKSAAWDVLLVRAKTAADKRINGLALAELMIVILAQSKQSALPKENPEGL